MFDVETGQDITSKTKNSVIFFADGMLQFFLDIGIVTIDLSRKEIGDFIDFLRKGSNANESIDMESNSVKYIIESPDEGYVNVFIGCGKSVILFGIKQDYLNNLADSLERRV